jgi:hypothetical protein
MKQFWLVAAALLLTSLLPDEAFAQRGGRGGAIGGGGMGGGFRGAAIGGGGMGGGGFRGAAIGGGFRGAPMGGGFRGGGLRRAISLYRATRLRRAISLYRATRLHRAINLYRPTLCPSRVLSRPSGRVLSAAAFHSAVLWCGLVCGRLRLLVVLELGANGVRLATGLGVWSLRLRLWRLLLLIA